MECLVRSGYSGIGCQSGVWLVPFWTTGTPCVPSEFIVQIAHSTLPQRVYAIFPFVPGNAAWLGAATTSAANNASAKDLPA